MSTVRRFILNVGSSWLAMLVRIGSNFLLYPYVIYKTSDASCGVWRTAMSFLVCTALLDFGLGMAIRRYAARFAALKSGEDQQRLMSTATVFYAAGGLLVMLVLFAVAPFSPTFFKDIPPELGDQTRQLFFLVGIVAFLRLMTTPFMAFLQGLQHITTYNLANIASNVLRLGGTMVVMEMLEPRIAQVGWVTLAGELAGAIIVILGSFRAWPGLRVAPRYFSRDHLRMIGGFAINAFIITLAGLVLSQAPNLIISTNLGAAAVAVYGAGLLVSMTIGDTIGVLASVLMPMFSECDALEDRQTLERRLWQGSLLGNAITWMTIVGVLMNAEPLILQWLGPDMIESYWPLVVLVAGEVSSGFSTATSSALAGYGHLRWLMLTRAFGAVFGLAAGVVAVEYLGWGIAGVALAVTVPTTTRGFWLVWYTSRRLDVPFWPFVWRSAARPFVAAGCIAAACLVLRWAYPIQSRVDLAVTIVILAVCAVVAGVGVALPPSMRRQLLGGVAGLFKRRLATTHVAAEKAPNQEG